MFKQLINAIAEQSDKFKRQVDYVRRFRYILRKLNHYFPFMHDIERWVYHNGYDNDETFLYGLFEKYPHFGFSVYHVCVLKDFIRSSLIAQERLAKTSRKKIIYFDHRVGMLLYGHREKTNEFTIYVPDLDLKPAIELVVKSYVERHAPTELQRQLVKVNVVFISAEEIKELNKYHDSTFGIDFLASKHNHPQV